MKDLIFGLFSAALIQELDDTGCYLVVEPNDDASFLVELNNQNGQRQDAKTFDPTQTPDLIIVSARLIIEGFKSILASNP